MAARRARVGRVEATTAATKLAPTDPIAIRLRSAKISLSKVEALNGEKHQVRLLSKRTPLVSIAATGTADGTADGTDHSKVMRRMGQSDLQHPTVSRKFLGGLWCIQGKATCYTFIGLAVFTFWDTESAMNIHTLVGHRVSAWPLKSRRQE